jgi:hypothetical protein
MGQQAKIGHFHRALAVLVDRINSLYDQLYEQDRRALSIRNRPLDQLYLKQRHGFRTAPRKPSSAR